MSDPNSTEWTEEEVKTLPQTTQVFDAPKLVIKEHAWVQEGYMIRDACIISKPTCVNAGIPIPPGSLLIKTKQGTYDLVDETDREARRR
jgi:hypothetical protein